MSDCLKGVNGEPILFLDTKFMNIIGRDIKQYILEAFNENISVGDECFTSLVIQKLIDERHELNVLPNGERVILQGEQATDISNIIMDPSLYIASILQAELDAWQGGKHSLSRQERTIFLKRQKQESLSLLKSLQESDKEYLGE